MQTPLQMQTVVASVTFTEEWVSIDSMDNHSIVNKNNINRTSRDWELGFSVFQKNHKWFVRHNDLILDFFDGIRLAR